jgi:3-hydroxybutyryl-CoA dehydratase
MLAHPHERFSSVVTLTPKAVADYASAVGDTNPLHHDAAFAATTRYARLIASGPHTAALLLALTASHYSTRGSVVGLEFWVRFRRPVFADETIRLEWLVVKVTPNDKLGGDVVDMRGRIVGADGKTALGAKGRVLVTARL